MRWQQLVSTAPVSDTIYDRVFDRPYPVYEPEEDEPAESAPFMVRFDMPEKSSSLHAYHVQQAAFLHVNMYINGMHSTTRVLFQTRMKEHYEKEKLRVVRTAGTYLQAHLTGAEYIEAWSGISVRTPLDELNPETVDKWRDVDVLILDQVSSLPGEMLTRLDGVAKWCRKDDRPFGGIQVVFIGDFYQACPSDLAFQSEVWKEALKDGYVGLLDECYTDDGAYTRFLRQMQKGSFTPEMLEYVKMFLRPLPAGDETVIHLFARYEQASAFNKRKLNELPGPMSSIEAVDSGSTEEAVLKERFRSVRVPSLFKFKVGAQVMKRRHILHPFTPLHLYRIVDAGPDHVVIRNAKKEIRVGKIAHSIGSNIEMGVREQVPLVLGWAFTVEEVRGVPLYDYVVIDFDGMDEPGMAYTALSIVVDPQKLRIVNFREENIRTLPEVEQFMYTQNIS